MVNHIDRAVACIRQLAEHDGTPVQVALTTYAPHYSTEDSPMGLTALEWEKVKRLLDGLPDSKHA